MNKKYYNKSNYDIIRIKGHYYDKNIFIKASWGTSYDTKKLSELTGIRRNAINEWYHEITVSLKLEHIDKICEVLDCSVEELIEYIPNKIPKTGKNLIIEEHGNRKRETGM